jgi:hypothetical protein
MEKAIFPLRFLAITQGVNEHYSHQGTLAIDCGFKIGDENSKKLYAPFTGVIRKIYTKSGNCVWLESIDKVLWADGTVDYATLLVVHCDDVSHLKVGQIINQNEYFYKMGKSGNATGVHVHLEVGKGKFSGTGWYQNKYGIWTINNGVHPANVFFLTEDTILKDSKYQWKTLPKILGTPVKRDINTTQIEVLTDILRVRDNPNGNILGYIKKGVYNVLNSKKLDDYLWCEVEPDKWIAYSSDWAIFYEKEVKHEQPKEEAKEDTLENAENMPNTEQTYDSGINIPDNTKNVVESEKTIKYSIFVKLFIEILKLIQKIFKKGDDK